VKHAGERFLHSIHTRLAVSSSRINVPSKNFVLADGPGFLPHCSFNLDISGGRLRSGTNAIPRSCITILRTPRKRNPIVLQNANIRRELSSSFRFAVDRKQQILAPTGPEISASARLMGTDQLYDKDQVGQLKAAVGVAAAHSEEPVCKAQLPAICGMQYVNVSDDSTYVIRLANRYQELQLPGTATLHRGGSIIATSEDLSSIIFPGASLRLGNIVPLLVASRATNDGVLLVDPYVGISDYLAVPFFAINVQLTPGLYDATMGATIITPSTDVNNQPLDPYVVVPPSIIANSESKPDAVEPLGTLRPGDHIVIAGVVGGVVDTMVAAAPVTSKRLLLTAYSLQSAFPHPSVRRQRTFRFVDSEFPGVSPAYVASWRARHGIRPQNQIPSASGRDDAEDVISSLRSEAGNLYPSNDSSTHSGMASMPWSSNLGDGLVTHASAVVGVPCEMLKLLSPGDVLRLGSFAAYTIVKLNTVQPCAFTLESSYPGSTGTVPVYALRSFSPLPGVVSINHGGASLSTTENLVSYVQPGAVLLLATSPPIYVVVDFDQSKLSRAVTPSSVGVSPHFRLSNTISGSIEGLRAFSVGVFAAHSMEGEQCTATLTPQSAIMQIAQCDPRQVFVPCEEVFVGDPRSWTASAPLSFVVDIQEGKSISVIKESSISMSRAFSGTPLVAAPLFRSGSQILPGTATLSPGETFVRTEGLDPRPYLQSGDLILVGDYPAMIVAGGSIPILSKFMSDQRVPIAAGEGVLLGVASNGFYITEEFVGSAHSVLPIRRTGLRLLPGRGSMSGMSSIIFTSADTRLYVSPGSVVQLLPALRLPVASSIVSDTETASTPVAGVISASQIQLRELVALPRLTAEFSDLRRFSISQCPVLPILSAYTIAAEPVHLLAELQTKESQCVAQRSLADLREWRALLIDTRNVRNMRPQDPDGEFSVKQLPGSVSVVAGSAIVASTADLSDYLADGDTVLVGSSDKPFVVASPPSATGFHTTIVQPGPTASGLLLFVQYRRVRLSSTLDVVGGTPYAVTHADLRNEIALGDRIEIASTASGKFMVREYAVLSPLTASNITLSEAYTGASEAGCQAFKLIGGAAPGTLLPGTIASITGGSTLSTTEDLSGSVRAGDRLRVTTIDVVAAEPITSSTIGIAAPYPGTSGSGLKAYNMGRSQHQMSLEQLARLKLQCRSIFCLAKIEEMERAIPSDVTRSLNAAALAGSDVSGAATAGEARDSLLARQAAAEDAIEREWQAWFQKAKGQLNIADGWIGDQQASHLQQLAKDAAVTRVGELHGQL
jgi:hypothetical protein